MRSTVLPFIPRPLPSYSTRLVGRDAELAALSNPDPCAPITLVGPGGVGKSRLAIESARASQAPALFVDASPARDADTLVRALLRSLGSAEPLHMTPLDEVVDRIRRGGFGFVLLDNLEQLGSEAIPVVERLCELGELRVMCTSRRALGAAREQVFPVAPLAPQAAVDMFSRALPHIGAARAGFESNQPELMELVELLDCNPLAIELAAGRTAVLPLDEVLRQIYASPTRVLRDPGRSAGRGSDLALSVAWSCDLLPPEARLGLVYAAAFAGAFDIEAARAVITLPGSTDEVLDVLAAWHLVRAVGPRRFALYQAVRAFVSDTLADDLQPAIERHATFYLGRVSRVADTAAPAVSLLEDSDEIDLIYERGLAEGALASRLSAARRTAAKAHRLELLRRRPSEHRALAERLIQAGPIDDDTLPLLADAGLMSLHLGDRQAARAHLERLESLARERGNLSMEGLALIQLANVEQIEGNLESIAALTDRALVVARQAADPVLEVWALGGVALNVALQEGDYASVAARVDQAITIARALTPELLARMLYQRLSVDLALRDWTAAKGRLDEIHEIHRGAGQVSWFHHEMLARIEMLAQIGERGSGSVERVLARLEACGDRIEPAGAACLSILAGFAERLAGRGSLRLRRGRAALEDVPLVDTRLRLSAVVAAGLALDGIYVPLDVFDAATPSARAVLDLARCVQDVAMGRLLPDDAALIEIQPPSAWTHVLVWALDAAIAQRRAEMRAWEVGPGGEWFCAPGGVRVDLSRRPSLARLVDALVERGALQAAEMFAAGWPGEQALADAKANRVRVAVAELRRLGLEILRWQRERGWFLGADVRRAPIHGTSPPLGA